VIVRDGESIAAVLLDEELIPTLSLVGIMHHLLVAELA
jgi:hypothetical protein